MPNDFSSTTNSPGILKDYYIRSGLDGNKIAESVLKKRIANTQAKLDADEEKPS